MNRNDLGTEVGRSAASQRRATRPTGGAAKASPAKPSIPNAVEAELDLAELARLLSDATRGPWYISRGLMGDDLDITAYEREGSEYTPRDKRDGPICHVSTEKHHWHHDKDHFGNPRGESRSWKTPIHKAQADAQLIVAAVNALPELLRRLGFDGSETAWLIEWPADDYGPIRYWAAGKPRPVIDPNKATRFARREDAVAAMGAYAENGAKVHEHMWMPSASAIETQSATTAGRGPQDESAVPPQAGDAPTISGEQ